MLTIALLQLEGMEALRKSGGLHAVDEVLSNVGVMLDFGIRTEDLRGHWGEDTFAVALLGAVGKSVDRVVQRLRDSLSTTGLKLRTSTAQFPTDGTSMFELLTLAQNRLEG